MSARIGSPARARLAIAVLAAVAATMVMLIGPANSSADDYFGYDHDYQGRVEKGKLMYIGFDHKKSGKTNGKISRISTIIPFACTTPGGPTDVLFAVIRIKGSFKYKNGKLNVRNKKVKFRYFSGPALNGRLTLTGTFKGKKASGKIALSSTAGGESCKYGVMSWQAKRGATVTLTP